MIALKCIVLQSVAIVSVEIRSKSNSYMHIYAIYLISLKSSDHIGTYKNIQKNAIFCK